MKRTRQAASQVNSQTSAPPPDQQTEVPTEEDLEFAVILKGINAPPQIDLPTLMANREDVRRRLKAFQEDLPTLSAESFDEEADAPSRILTAGTRMHKRTISFPVLEQIRSRMLGETPVETVPRDSIGLARLLKRFDWRDFGVAPRVRQQHPDCGSCWAYVATEAIEGSLMRQRANFKTLHEPGSLFNQPVSVNVKNTFDCVRGDCDNGGRHEHAFTYYVNVGIPLDAIVISDNDDDQFQDSNLLKGRCRRNETTETIKAIGWDYVHLPPHEVPPEQGIKEALLEHGPLVMMMHLDDTDTAFFSYGRNTGNDAAPVYDSRTTGQGNHFVLLVGWTDSKEAWIIQNSFGAKWGYSCSGPSNDRGFMLIRWGSNGIGRYAAWVEAPLIDQGLTERIKSQMAGKNRGKQQHADSEIPRRRKKADR